MLKEAGKMKVGVLSLQGGVIEHIKHLQALGVEALEIKKPEELEDIEGIILPGGESTTMGKLLRDTGIFQPLKDKINKGLPVWGTCAGMILLAKNIINEDKVHLGVMDIEVLRNAYGRQLGSFKTEGIISEVSNDAIPLVFIRAPYITNLGLTVNVLHTVNGKIVAATQNNMLATSFHPELTESLEFHRYFIEMIGKQDI